MDNERVGHDRKLRVQGEVVGRRHQGGKGRLGDTRGFVDGNGKGNNTWQNN